MRAIEVDVRYVGNAKGGLDNREVAGIGKGRYSEM